jgi:hypothetical protein
VPRRRRRAARRTHDRNSDERRYESERPVHRGSPARPRPRLRRDRARSTFRFDR